LTWIQSENAAARFANGGVGIAQHLRSCTQPFIIKNRIRAMTKKIMFPKQKKRRGKSPSPERPWFCMKQEVDIDDLEAVATGFIKEYVITYINIDLVLIQFELPVE
jgi:hypothetical protein